MCTAASLSLRLRKSCCRETQRDASLSQFYEDVGNAGFLPEGKSTIQVVRNGSLEDLGDGADIVVISGNTGLSALLFDNPRYKHQLIAMGLRPEDAFPCAMEFLFAPNTAVQDYFKHDFEVMSGDAFKIGIQMRLGDYFVTGRAALRSEHHRNAEPVLTSVQHFLDCAEQIEATYKLPEQQVVWFVISDSIDLRHLVQAQYGSKVLTRVIQPAHIFASEDHDKRRALIEAVGEHWLFGLADYHVVSNMGSFGKTGALRRHTWNSIFQLNIQHVPELGEVVCDGLTTRAMDYGEISRWAPYI